MKDTEIYTYTLEWVLQYLCNMKHNLAAPVTKIMKVTNCSEYTWYSLNATHHICLYGLEHGLGTYGFRSTWPCLIIEVLGTQVRFLEPSGYLTVIKCTFTFCTTNFFGWFYCFIAQFKLVQHKFPNQTVLFIYLFGFQIIHGVKLCSDMPTHQLLLYYWPQWISSTAWMTLVIWYTCCKLPCTRILQSFLISLVWPSQLELLNTPTASLQRGKKNHNKCSGYDIKPSNGQAT